MNRLSVLGSLILSGVVVFAGASRAQAPTAGADPFHAEVDVQLIELEVAVTTRDGAPVRGLRKEEFRLVEDGAEVPLQSVTELGEGGGAAATGTPGAQAAGPPTHLVVFLDELHTTPVRRRELYTTLARGLAQHLPSGAQVMIARYEGGLQVLLPFTDKRAAIVDVLGEAVGFVSGIAVRGEAERVSVMDSIRFDAREGPCLFGDQLARQYADRLRGDANQLMRTLDGLVGALDTVPGRKALLYVGDGVTSRPGEEALDFYIELCTGEGMARGVDGARDTSTFGVARFHRPDPEKLRLEAASYDMGDDWERLAARANGVGVPLHTLALRGPAPAGGSIEADERGPSIVVTSEAANAAGEVAALLADETGGTQLIADASVGEAVGGVLAPRDGYLLSFAPPRPDDPRPRHLDVEVVGRPELRVRHRASYAPIGGTWQVVDRLLAVLYLGAGENPLQLRAQTRKSRTEDVARVHLQVPLSRLTLLPEGDEMQGRFTVFVLTRDTAGALSEVRQKEVPVRLASRDLSAAQQRDFVYEVSLPASVGPRQVAVGVRDEISGELAVVRADR
jgi:VWFA-related protein